MTIVLSVNVNCWYVWTVAVTHRGLILLTVFTPRLSTLLQTDALLQNLSEVILLYCLFWQVKVKLILFSINKYRTISLSFFFFADSHLSLHESIHVPGTHLESSAPGNAWWRAMWGRNGPSPCHSDTGCCSQLHIQTIFQWQTHQMSPESCKRCIIDTTQTNELSHLLSRISAKPISLDTSRLCSGHVKCFVHVMI